MLSLEKNFNKFIEKGFPNKRIEEWKFSDLNQIISTNFENLDFSKKDDQTSIDVDFIHEFEQNKIVFINGSVSKIDLSYENENKIILNQDFELDEDLSKNVLINLNTAFLNNCIKITVNKGYKFQKPLILYNYLTSDLDSHGLNMRLDIDLEDDTSLDVINISNESSKSNFLNFRQKINIGKNYDKGGAWAAQGVTIKALLSNLMDTPYLFISPPKNTGPELFNIDWLESLLEQLPKYRPVDIQATLLEFTAQTISKALSLYSYNINEVFICGGGAYNTVLINRLKELIAPIVVENTSILGIAPEWVEASAFAWLAKQTVEGLPGNVPAATGAEKSSVLGAMYTK